MYATKNDFINAIKGLEGYKSYREVLEQEIAKINYDLYKPIKAPNDYDIAGYDSKNEAVRVLKQGGRSGKSEWDYKNELEKKKKELQFKASQIDKMISEAETALEALPSPLKEMCVDKFIKGKTYNQIAPLYFMAQSSLYRYMMRELDAVFDAKNTKCE